MARGPKEAARRNAELLAARARRMTNLQMPALATVKEIEAHIAKAYATQSDPYGGAWPPLKYREEPPPALRLTDESRKDIKVGANRGNLRVNAMDRVWFQAGGIPSANVPARSVVIPGTRAKKFPAGEYQLPCALIIGKRSASTDQKTSLNAVLRLRQIRFALTQPTTGGTK